MDSLVTTEWLANELGASDIRIVDASKHLPEAGRDARAEYLAAHIPGAVFMDLGELVDADAPIENTLPTAAKFASRMQALGLGDGSRIVIYDDSAIKSSARAWFMLRLFGAQNVALLDGGIAKWKAEGRPLASGEEKQRRRHYTTWCDDAQLRSKAQVLANIESKAEQLVDARGKARFTGAEPEARPGLAAGHIPSSLNVPFGSLFNADGTWKDAASLKQAFVSAGVDLSRPIVTSCGSGITACCVAFGLHLVGKDDVSLYDGSWTEWGSDPNTPKAIGEAADA
ncbi:MAG: 3-mercaptopyruvate sulfurtransferase [Novosphingobium sp.]